jgi:hypothetical protein
MLRALDPATGADGHFPELRRILGPVRAILQHDGAHFGHEFLMAYRRLKAAHWRSPLEFRAGVRRLFVIEPTGAKRPDLSWRSSTLGRKLPGGKITLSRVR